MQIEQERLVISTALFAFRSPPEVITDTHLESQNVIPAFLWDKLCLRLTETLHVRL